MLQQEQKALLRGGYFLDTGEWQPYQLGRLKTYNSKKGFGFLECPEVYNTWGRDVFIHKNDVPDWCIVGQVAEFWVGLNNNQQPQARDVKFYAPLLIQGSLFESDEPDAGEMTTDPSGALTAAVQQPVIARHGAKPAGKRYLGRLKSLAREKYGFLVSEEVTTSTSKDIFFDKREVKGYYQPNQVVEFTLQYNHSGYPQAKDIDWAPIPQLQGTPLVPSEKLVKDLQNLLDRLAGTEFEQAVEDVYVLCKNRAQTEDVDFLCFLLERMHISRVPALSSTHKIMLILLITMQLEFVSVKMRTTGHKWLSSLFAAIEEKRAKHEKAPELTAEESSMSMEEVTKAFKVVVKRLGNFCSQNKGKLAGEEEKQWKQLTDRAKALSSDSASDKQQPGAVVAV